jgi:lipoprotein-anchoring transpeptidase ErfK/SrfK
MWASTAATSRAGAAGSGSRSSGKVGLPRSVANLLTVASLALIAACQPPLPANEVQRASAFAGEPYPVRLVNRAKFDATLRPAVLPNTTGEAPGTIVIDTGSRHLYLVESADKVLRYGIAVGTAGYAWKGTATIGRKAEWPAWYPTDDMKAGLPGIPARIPPGPDNPLGARALYLYAGGRDTLYRIHGTSEPWTIGTRASSGCIRMFNEDVIALYDKVRVGTKVIVR